MEPEPRLVSFVLRFVREEAPTGDADSAAHVAPWHGIIRHVQSNNERHFTRWADAVGFIAEYVEVDDANDHG